MAETTELLLNFYAGDESALGDLLDRHMRTLHGMVHRKLGWAIRSKEETGDMVQEAAIRFLQYGPRIRVTNEPTFLALLLRVVENVIRDKHDFYTRHRRAMSREESIPDTILDLSTPSQAAIEGEEKEWVCLGLNFLEKEERLLIADRDWEQLSFVDLGKKMNLPAGTVRKRYQQAVIQLAAVVSRLRKGELNQILRESGHLEP